MQLLIVSATPFEIEPLRIHLKKYGRRNLTDPDSLRMGELVISFLITGVGQMMTAYHLSQQFNHQKYDLVIHAGIAGAYPGHFEIGSVVEVRKDRLADLGVEEADGSFTDVFELELTGPDSPPFQGGWLVNERTEGSFLPDAVGLTVNKVSGHTDSIQQISEKYPEAQIETMESAAVFLVCLEQGIPFLSIRSISNLVEKRDRDQWDIPLAINRLNEVLIEMINSLAG